MSLTETTEIPGRNSLLHDQVRETIANTFLVDVSELPDEINQTTCGQWTSLYHMMLLVALEEQFDVTLSTAEMIIMTSLDAIVAVLDQHGVGHLSA